MAQQIISELENALDTTITLLSSLDEKSLNSIPFKGSWTAAQVGRHLYKSENGTDQLLAAVSKPCNRPPDAGVEGLKKILFDFDHKLNSPDFLLPEEQDYDKERLIKSLHDVKGKMLQAAQTHNLADIAPLPEGHPLNGSSKLEIVHFMAYHTIRHNQQIKKISGIVAG